MLHKESTATGWAAAPSGVVGYAEGAMDLMPLRVNYRATVLEEWLDVMEHIAAAFDNLIADHRALDWEPPLCGVMSP